MTDDEIKLEKITKKMNEMIKILRNNNMSNEQRNIIEKNTKYLIQCHDELLKKVYEQTKKEVDEIPLIPFDIPLISYSYTPSNK